MINYQPLGRLPNFFRLVLPSAGVCAKEDVDLVLRVIAETGDRFFATAQAPEKP